MFWSAGTAMSISVHFRVSLCTTSNIWPIMFQHFVCVDSHVPGNPHFSIFCGWQGLMVISLVITLYPILPVHLPVYPQGHLVVTLPILSLSKLLASTDNVSYCFSGISTQSTLKFFRMTSVMVILFSVLVV